MRKLVVITLLCFSISGLSQSYNFISYTQSSGISSSNVKRIQQDSYGFIWMGTQDGLTRWDGTSAVLFNKPQLDRNDISDLFYDARTHNLWISYSQGGISALNTTNLQPVLSLSRYRSYHKIAGLTIRSVLVDYKQRLWIGTDDGLFIMPDITKDSIIAVPISMINKGDLNWIIKIAEDHFHNILVAVSHKGVFVFPKGNISQYSYFSLPNTPKQIYSASLDTAQNYFLLATEGEVYIFNLKSKRMEPLSAKVPLNKSYIFSGTNFCAASDGRNQLWISTNSGLFIVDGYRSIRKASITGTIESDLNHIPEYIFFDYNKNIWLCTRNGCFYTNAAPSPFTKFIKSDKNNIINHLYFLYPQDVSLLACDENGLYKLNYSNQTVLVCDSNQSYYLFFKDFKGNTICSNDKGLFLWDDKKNRTTISIDKLFPEWTLYKQNYFCCNLSYGDSLVILGSNNSTGIYIWNTKRHTIANITEEKGLSPLKNGTVNMLYKRDNHSFWILSDSYIQIFDLQDYSVKDLTAAFSGIDYFFDIVSTRSKNYIACYGSGILEVDSNLNILRTFTTKSGLSNNCVYRIIPESDSIIWATTNFGINRININSGKISKYFKEDGLNTNEFEEFSANQKGDKIFVGGLGGLTIIDPSKLSKNTKAPLLYYTGIKTETKTGLLNSNNIELRNITIPNNWLQVTILFAGLNYTNPTRVIYKYRIKEQDANWIDNGHQNFISIIGLEPGTYTLQVKAANEDVYWSEPRELMLTILPKWYQTFLFKILIFIIIVSFFFTLYKLRLGYLKQQQQIRQSISADLHDDIGGTLNGIKMFAHMAEVSEDKQPYLNEISESVNQATIGLRDMIWVLDDKKDTVAEMVERLRQFAIPVASTQNIHVDITSDGESDVILDKAEKRNFLLIAKESINNAVKYSGCKNINVTFSPAGKKISLIIRDDGNGFDMNKYRAGNGLKNIKERAKQINYRAVIQSKIGSGTEIYIII